MRRVTLVAPFFSNSVNEIRAVANVWICDLSLWPCKNKRTPEILRAARLWLKRCLLLVHSLSIHSVYTEKGRQSSQQVHHGTEKLYVTSVRQSPHLSKEDTDGEDSATHHVDSITRVGSE